MSMVDKVAGLAAVAALAAIATYFGGLVGAIGALACALFGLGAFLWLQGSGDKDLDEVGRSLMLGVFLAVAVGVPQYLLDQRQKDPTSLSP